MPQRMILAIRVGIQVEILSAAHQAQQEMSRDAALRPWLPPHIHFTSPDGVGGC